MTKCLFCKKSIKSVDLEFEDYFTIIRGSTQNAVYGYVCFDCFEDTLSDSARNLKEARK